MADTRVDHGHHGSHWQTDRQADRQLADTDSKKTLNPRSGVLFVSKASVDNGNIKSYDLTKQIEPVKKCRTVTKHDMKFNNATPAMEVDPESFVCPFPAFSCSC